MRQLPQKQLSHPLSSLDIINTRTSTVTLFGMREKFRQRFLSPLFRRTRRDGPSETISLIDADEGDVSTSFTTTVVDSNDTVDTRSMIPLNYDTVQNMSEGIPDTRGSNYDGSSDDDNDDDYNLENAQSRKPAFQTEMEIGKDVNYLTTTMNGDDNEIAIDARLVTTQTLQRIDSDAVKVASISAVELEKEPKNRRKLQSLNLSQESLYRLPDVGDRKLTELEEEFRGMLADFTHYSARDILCLRDFRLRLLFEGIVASADEPLVYRAFEVLYEDLYPLRIGGRIIYRKLKQIMEDSLKEHSHEVEAVVTATRLDEESVREARLGFVAVAMYLNRDAYFTIEQLTSTGLTEAIANGLGDQSASAFLEKLKRNPKGRCTFVELMDAIYKCAEETCALDQCDPAELVIHTVGDLLDRNPSTKYTLDEKHERLSLRYDEMVASFITWEGLLPPVEDDMNLGRRQARVMEVVRGCFKGAENRHVVDALRVLYTDYTPLRIAGDFIFGCVQQVMKNRQRQ